MIYSDPLSSFLDGSSPLLDDELTIPSPDIDSVYTERNMCVSLLAKMALSLALPTGLRDDPEESEEFRTVCCILLPAGEISWHIPASERHLFAGLPEYTRPYEEYDTLTKYERVMNPGNLDPLFSFDAQTNTLTLVSVSGGTIPHSEETSNE